MFKAAIVEISSYNFTRFEFKLTLDGDNQLRDHGQHFSTSLLKHIENTLDRKEAVGVLLFSNTLEEDGQVVMVIQLHHIDLPENFVWWSVLNSDRQIATVVETSKLAGNDSTGVKSTSLRFLGGRHSSWL